MSKNRPSIKTYTIGFVLSVVLTLFAFAIVVSDGFPYWAIVFVILSLAVVQLFVQLYFFLHIKDEGKPKLKMHTFISALIVVIIVVFGSLWIMESLSRYHGHNVLPEDIDSHIQNEEAIYR
jgi:cytochrome o ubiquinol oxidase subunit IV